MAPIRVGIIGLSSAEITGGAGTWGVVAHLASFQNLPGYEVVAVANSSIESSRKAIEKYALPAETKAYGSPEELASDPNVDLVVVSVVVTKHLVLTKPALLKKKQVFVEWPLGASLAEAEELTELAKANGLKTVVGLQARADPLTVKLRELIGSGKIGQVVSSSVLGNSSVLPTAGWPEGSEYYLDLKSGGNEYHIFFGHFLDTLTNVLGDLSDIQSSLKTQFPTVPIVGEGGKVVNPAYPKTSPDHINVLGTLPTGAPVSISFRKAQPASADGVGVRWIITGTEGEIEVTAPEFHWQMSHPEQKLRLKVGKEAAVDVDFADNSDENITKVAMPGTNTARVYDSFLKGDTSRFATFESALKTHRLLDEIVRRAGLSSE